jgi:hypothetical protein
LKNVPAALTSKHRSRSRINADTVQRVRMSLRNALAVHKSRNRVSVGTVLLVRMSPRSALAANNRKNSSVVTALQARMSLKNVPAVLTSKHRSQNRVNADTAQQARMNSRNAPAVLINSSSNSNSADTAQQVRMNSRNAPSVLINSNSNSNSNSADTAQQAKVSMKSGNRTSSCQIPSAGTAQTTRVVARNTARIEKWVLAMISITMVTVRVTRTLREDAIPWMALMDELLLIATRGTNPLQSTL